MAYWRKEKAGRRRKEEEDGRENRREGARKTPASSCDQKSDLSGG